MFSCERYMKRAKNLYILMPEEALREEAPHAVNINTARLDEQCGTLL